MTETILITFVKYSADNHNHMLKFSKLQVATNTNRQRLRLFHLYSGCQGLSNEADGRIVRDLVQVVLDATVHAEKDKSKRFSLLYHFYLDFIGKSFNF